jgi:cysteine desulfurase
MSIYLDYAAATPLDPRVLEKMQAAYLSKDLYGNPASQHVFGKTAREAIAEARSQVADYCQAEPAEIIFTSGATEANNLAIKGAAALYQRKGKHIITMKTEHKSVLDVCQHLEKQGFLLTYLAPDAKGLLALDQLQAALRPDTLLVSLMHVNNETGVIQDIARIAELTAAQGILLHVDAAQTVGKLPLDLSSTPIDLVSFSAHKVYGPKGIGALYLRKKPRVRVQPLLHGGGQEQGMRSGTLATELIIGMGEAFALAKQELSQDQSKMRHYRNCLLQGLSTLVDVNGTADASVASILNLCFKNILADELLTRLPFLCASTASACQGGSLEGSHVLRAMGLNEAQIKSALRLSFGRFTRQEEVDEVIAGIQGLV